MAVDAAPNLVKFGPSPAKFDHSRPNLGQSRPGLVQILASWADLGPILEKIDLYPGKLRSPRREMPLQQRRRIALQSERARRC